MTAAFPSPVARVDAEHHGGEKRTTPGRLWLAAYVVLAAIAAARLPGIRVEVRSQLARSEVAAQYAELKQADLAVQIGTTTALLVIMVGYLLVFVCARALELRLPVPVRYSARGWPPVSLAFAVVATVTIGIQGVMLLLGVTSPRSDGRVWAVALLAAVLSAVFVRPQARTLAATLRNAGLALLFAAACLLV